MIAGGGTGGHLFPALSIAQSLRKLYPEYRIVFVGTRTGIESRVIPKTEFELITLSVSGLYRVGFVRKVKGILRLFKSVFDCLLIVRKYRPVGMVGVGGYASGPLLISGLLRGVPVFMQEQNYRPGMTNRFLGKFSRKSFLAYPDENSIFRNAVVVGNPVRREIEELSVRPVAPVTEPFRIFVVGGSQGSAFLNETVPAAILELGEENITVTHQCGRNNADKVRGYYAGAKCELEVTEFIEDMAAALKAATLIISRSGSGVYEFLAAGRASILVPIAWASGDHQRKNAVYLTDNGAALYFDQASLTPAMLTETLRELIHTPGRVTEMAENARKLYSGGAADAIARGIVEELKTN